MNSAAQNLEARIEEAILVKVLAYLFSGRKMSPSPTTHTNGHGSKPLLLPHPKPSRARKHRIRLRMSESSIFQGMNVAENGYQQNMNSWV